MTGADPETSTSGDDHAVTLIKTPHEILTHQKRPSFVGISAETAGARGMSMSLFVIPPGASAQPHFHKSFESAVYVL